MLRYARRTVLVLLTMLSTAMIAETALPETPTTQQGEKAGDDADRVRLDLSDTKVLVAFDPYSGERADRKQRQEAFQQALKEAEVQIVTTYHYGNYLLLDCGTKEPAELLKTVPYHAGAIVFRDGELVTAIAAHDKKKTPKNCAILRWGSTANDVKRMQADIKKYSNMPGVVAEKINLRPGEVVFGNPWILKLTPGEGKTLLDIFVLAEAQFDYAEVQGK